MAGTTISLSKRFQETEYIGEGDYGAVFKARDTQSQDIVALKMSPSSSFAHEYKLLRDLNHPNVIRVRECGRYRNDGAADTPRCENLDYLVGAAGAYMSMDLVETTKVYGMGPRPMAYIRGVLLGLAYLHSQRIVHGDVRSHNVLIAKDGTPRIIDLGVAARLPWGLRQRLTLRGMYSYQRDVCQTFNLCFFEAWMNVHAPRKETDAIDAKFKVLKQSPLIQAWFNNDPPSLAALEAELNQLCPDDAVAEIVFPEAEAA